MTTRIISAATIFGSGFLFGVWAMHRRVKRCKLARAIEMFRLMSGCYERTKQPGPAKGKAVS